MEKKAKPIPTPREGLISDFYMCMTILCNRKVKLKTANII